MGFGKKFIRNVFKFWWRQKARGAAVIFVSICADVNLRTQMTGYYRGRFQGFGFRT